MGTIIFSGTAVLVVLGFGNHLYWLAAVAVLFLYLQYGRDSSPTSSSGGSGRMPSDYRSYRNRRDEQAKWERRYRRERPFESRRQEREKGKEKSK
ncbi:hypothetical protein [Streptomyces sp. GESEQ-35]|uniref:hypothetical protein n=1 Tax=Streptomyces sp. GESEQ-35 TaxID=2812657 RepID=UPI001B3264ED|nr:hypothetical protein [Streptomyces sp. GESEQ-35]